jgi:hypothetical protein
MRHWNISIPWFAALALLLAGLTGCAASSDAPASEDQAAPASRWSFHDWPTGPYRVVDGWPKPLPDDRHSHAGWTWGSFGGVYRRAAAAGGSGSMDALRGAQSLPGKYHGQH